MTAFAKLSHAYGKASDVPTLLRDLAATDAKKRGRALSQLSASICHQGTFYSATPATVPRLVALLEDPKVKGKEGVLALLADLATLDEPERFCLTGFDSRLELRALPRLWVRAVDAVSAGAPVYRRLLGASDAKVRAAAAALLGWLDREAAASLEPVRQALSLEKNAVVRASLWLTLGFLTRATKAKDLALEREPGGLVRTAAALAHAHVRLGKVSAEVARTLAEAATDPKLAKTGLPWLGGNLALFAMRAVASLKATQETTEALLVALERGLAGSDFIAELLVRRLFPVAKVRQKAAKPKRPRAGEVVRRDLEDDAALRHLALKPDALSPPQRRLLVATCARLDGFGETLGAALQARGLPATLELMERWLAGEPAHQSPLDRRVGAKTVAELFAAAVKAKGAQRQAVVQALAKALPGDEAIDTAWAAMVSLDGDDVLDVALELAWLAGPRGEKALRAAVVRLERDGAPQRDEGHSIVHFIGCYVLVGVGLAAWALAKKRAAEPLVDRYLQRQYGFQPRVRDALAALPQARREAWVLSSARDKQVQPAEYFHGAWPYFVAVPFPAVTRRVLQHVAKWKPKDNWGGRREKYADPHLVAYLEVLRAAKQDTAACERALAKLRG